MSNGREKTVSRGEGLIGGSHLSTRERGKKVERVGAGKRWAGDWAEGEKKGKWVGKIWPKMQNRIFDTLTIIEIAIIQLAL